MPRVGHDCFLRKTLTISLAISQSAYAMCSLDTESHGKEIGHPPLGKAGVPVAGNRKLKKFFYLNTTVGTSRHVGGESFVYSTAAFVCFAKVKVFKGELTFFNHAVIIIFTALQFIASV
jgi:hypothetical protein